MDTLNDFSRPSIPKTGQGLYIMVPYKTPRSDVPSTDDLAFECEVVTDMWLERCLDARSLVPPESHVASTPFAKFPIPGEFFPCQTENMILMNAGFAGMRICSTGFARIDLLHLSKLVDLMGASYDEYLTPKASVLICNDPQTASHEKLRHTTEWGVPAVSAEWLWISIQAGQKKAFDPYVIRRQVSQPHKSGERAGNAPVHEKHQPQQAENVREARPKRLSPSSNGGQIEKPSFANKGNTRMMPIIGDGFSTEEDANKAPKPSVPESRSPSPETTANKPSSEDHNSKQSEQAHLAPSAPSAVPSALDTALKGLLQQAQAAKSRQQTERTNSKDEESYPPRRKRKPLLGRAPSHPSARTTETTRTTSRASSVDTLNDDGLGSALENTHSTRDNSLSRTNSRNDPSLSSMFSGKKFEFLSEKLPAHIENEDEENQEPPMTQLDYEDPDAAAMRAEFLRGAGKLVGKEKQPGSGVLVGEVRELEDVGWASGRRTRKQPPKLDD